MADESMEVDSSDGENLAFVAGPSSSSSSRVNDENAPAGHSRPGQKRSVASGSGGGELATVYDDSEWDEVIEESLVHVTLENADDASDVNASSNVRVIAVDTDSPVLQIENKIFRLNEWKYIPGTAIFFEKTKDLKKIDPLYDDRCGSVYQYVGLTRKCLEMTKKDTTM